MLEQRPEPVAAGPQQEGRRWSVAVWREGPRLAVELANGRGLKVVRRVSDMQVAVKRWFGVEYTCQDSYRTLVYEAGLSYQRTEGVYRSKPSQTAVADFEAEFEKK